MASTQSSASEATQVIDPNGTVANVAASNGAAYGNGLMVLPVKASAAAPTLAEGDAAAASVDLSGNLRVAGSTGGTSMTDAGTFTEGSSSLTPAGALYDDSPSALATGKVGVPRMSSKRLLRMLLRNPGDTVDLGDTANPGGAPRAPAMAGGCAPYSFLSTAAVQADAIKGSAGQLYVLVFFNNSATLAYGRLYDQAGAPASTDTANIKWRFLIPANTSGAGFVVPIPPGLAFASGIGLRVTGAVADNDNTALAANTILGNAAYK